MNQFSRLLADGAQEVLDYRRSSAEAEKYGADWLGAVAEAMTAASLLEDDSELEYTIHGIAHAIIDSGPLSDDFAPSFGKVLDAVQRREKRREKRQQKRRKRN